jgi:hypothetical protein
MSGKSPKSTLLWEALRGPVGNEPAEPARNGDSMARVERLPFDKRCVALTKSGKRCKGRIRNDSGFCVFHDPAVPAELRRERAAKGGQNRHPLSTLPDGYLRKLSSRRAVGDALDRLYREIRLGVVTPEMGGVLFNILSRLLTTGLVASAPATAPARGRSKADRLVPLLRDLLTRADRRAWCQAVKNAPRRPRSDAAAKERHAALRLSPARDGEGDATMRVAPTRAMQRPPTDTESGLDRSGESDAFALALGEARVCVNVAQ